MTKSKKPITSSQAMQIAKLHIFSSFYLNDLFEASNLSLDDNVKVTKAIRTFCFKELNKLSVKAQTTSDNCVESISDKK